MSRAARKVLIIAHSGCLGGAELCLDTTLRHLDRSRFEPVVVFGCEGPMIESARAMGIDAQVWPLAWWMCHEPSWWHRKNMLGGSIPRIWKLRRIIKRQQIDLVYTNTAVVFEGAVAARLARVPHVWHVHEVLTPDHMRPRSLPLGWIARLVGRLSDRVIFESNTARDIGHRRIDERKTLTVHNSVRFDDADLTETRLPARAALALTEDQHVVTWVGRFSPRKNPLMLLKAAARLRSHAKLRFLLVGEGPLEEEMRQAIREHRLENSCRIVPFQEDIRPILAACDVLVLSSEEESFGLVLVEAGACGKPVVATRVEGPAEIVVDGETGFLVEPGDDAALAEKIERLMADPRQRQSMGKAGARRVAKLFSAEKNTRKLESVFDEVLADHQGKRK